MKPATSPTQYLYPVEVQGVYIYELADLAQLLRQIAKNGAVGDLSAYVKGYDLNDLHTTASAVFHALDAALNNLEAYQK